MRFLGHTEEFPSVLQDEESGWGKFTKKVMLELRLGVSRAQWRE